MSPPKFVDPLMLIAALAVFLLGGFSMLGYAVGAGAWLIQRGIQEFAARRSKRELAAGNRQFGILEDATARLQSLLQAM